MRLSLKVIPTKEQITCNYFWYYMFLNSDIVPVGLDFSVAQKTAAVDKLFWFPIKSGLGLSKKRKINYANK